MNSEHTYRVGDRVKITMKGQFSSSAEPVYQNCVGEIGVIRSIFTESLFNNAGGKIAVQVLSINFDYNKNINKNLAFYSDELKPISSQRLFSFMGTEYEP